MKPFRILFRSIRDANKSVFRNFSLSIASIICATITLLVVGIALLIAVNVKNATNLLKGELNIIVYAERNSTQEDLDAINSKILEIKEVSGVTFKSSDEWKLEISQYSSDLATLFNEYDVSPLLNSYIVTVKDVNNLDSVTKEIRNIEHVESANYGEDTVKNILMVFDVIENITIVVVIALVFVTIFLITNTIKLTIYARKSEIEIMRLVGASNIAIKLPFIFEGFIIGVLGSIIPIIILTYGYIIGYDKLGGHIISNLIVLLNPSSIVIALAGAIVILGALIGMFGSLRAVRRYLKI